MQNEKKNFFPHGIFWDEVNFKSLLKYLWFIPNKSKIIIKNILLQALTTYVIKPSWIGAEARSLDYVRKQLFVDQQLIGKSLFESLAD
jgi:hypothetical protein